MINAGENNISVYAGDSEVSVYIGDELIYPLNFGELTGITMSGLTWVTDISWEGGTGTSANCSYVITGYYDSGKTRRLNSKTTVEGSITADSTTSETRDLVGTLVLTATCSGFSVTGSVDAYQEAYAPYPKKYLTFKITSDGNIVWKTIDNSHARTIEYKKNNGDWTTLTSSTGGATISVVTGDIIEFRGNNASYTDRTVWWNAFNGTTAGFVLEGNIMSLINSTGFATATTLSSESTFYKMFSGCTTLTDASNLILPATTLTTNCYAYMFYGCSSLTTAPELPATTLANYSYPFMFAGCTSLTTAPELPATTLGIQCYQYMFEGCSSLTTAPELPATTLTNYCYDTMFSGCRSLNYIKCLATDLSAGGCLNSWVYRVAATGTFVKKSGVSWPTGVNGIPSGWTVQEV